MVLNPNSFHVKYGFGYDDNIDDYKVVRISDGENYGCLDIQVYTLGSDSWHHVLTIPFSFCSESTFYSVLFNGALHWLGVITASRKASSKVILSFEISKEQLVHSLLPEENEKEVKGMGVLGDCICLIVNDLTYGRTNIWVMQDYGVQNSGTKRFTITQLPIDKYFSFQPIWSFESGEVLLDTTKDLNIYDTKSGKVRIAMSDTYISINREFYVESLVSVKSGTYAEKKPEGQSR
ncbi:F-box/kelch-repeat protein At3g06240-like [Papaver somniferum]|uniref:F-box/kelch-repeat protein At3g06240-like n=1 Tax=Papaver somniferum TaxID=3469 RepID=UPI000E6FE4DB|nr:F-box/kelch-repeat protein At3g06240-like [Papaver somniferum]